MNIYIYWPFLREEDFPLVDEIAASGDNVYAHVIDRPGSPTMSERGVRIDASLPEVRNEPQMRTLAWVGNRTRVYWGRAWGRERAVRRRRFDVLHVVYQNRFTDVVALRRLSRHGPLVCTVHDAWPHDLRVPRSVVRPYLRSLYRHSGAIIVLNEQLEHILIDEFDVDPDRIHVVPHQIPQFRSEPKVLSPEPTVLFFGTPRRNKGVDVLLRAVPKFAEAGVRVIVAGRGDPNTERQVLELGQRIDLLETHIGWVSATDKWRLFDRADLVLLPYNKFASESGVLNDAYGHHTPVVVTDVRSLGANVRHLGTGWVVPSGDSAALVEVSLRALNDRDAWHDAMTRCRERAFANRPSAVAAKMREVYKVAADCRWHRSRR